MLPVLVLVVDAAASAGSTAGARGGPPGGAGDAAAAGGHSDHPRRVTLVSQSQASRKTLNGGSTSPP